jgi:glucose-6-phosphate 1-epimerase
MITLKQLSNGFEYLEVHNDVAEAKIALQGAHLFHYERHNEISLLWVSQASAFISGQAIRGGIPLCWPWFGMHASLAHMPQHGFVRTLLWQLIDSSEHANATTLVLLLKSSDETLALWPYRFELTYTITIGETLTLELITNNCDDKAFTITQALHTYFNISDISNIHVKGLEEKPYFDAVTKRFGAEKGSICIHEEFDRVYQEVTEPVTLVDKHRSVTITNEGSASAIVWNPWIEKCARMSAMEPDSYKTMLCIESANALDDARTIAPNEHHALKTVITIG